nr:hypothetical protein [Tanacetum cinerariifolium]
MTTLAKFMIIAGANNRPPMLEKSLYDLWKSCMELYVENRENGRMILNSVQNGPLVWPTVVQEDGTTRTNKYEELSVAEKLQADRDLKATNIVLQGLVVPVFSQGDDPIAYLNKAMAFLKAVASSRPCTQPKRLGNTAWFMEKEMLAKAQESDQILDEEQLAFLAEPRIPDGQAAQTTILNNAAF